MRLRTTATALTAAVLLTACGGSDPDQEACETALTPFREHNEAVQAWTDAPEDDKPEVDPNGLDRVVDALREAAGMVEDPRLADLIDDALTVDPVSFDFFLAMNQLDRACGQ